MSTSAERMRRLRARRAEGLLPAPVPRLRELGDAVESSIAALNLGPEHAGMAQLARQYAAAIDQARDPAYAARWFGPLLLDALSSLGASPLARSRMRTAEPPPRAGRSQLELLRQSRPPSR